MSYWGTVVVARAQGLLVEQDGMTGFGYRHRWLRELGDEWQLVETQGRNDPPDLLGSSEAMVASTGHPVFAAYVSDGDCAVMCAAAPGAVGPLTHLWDVSGPCGTYRHQPWGRPEPVGRSVDEVVSELSRWSAAAGLRADAPALRQVITHEESASRQPVDDLLFDLVKALGVARIGRTLPWAFPIERRPFALITDPLGLATRAWSRSVYRQAEQEDGEAPEPAQPWEPAAIALERELWASLYHPGVDLPALVRRVAEVQAAYEAVGDRGGRAARDPDRLFESLFAGLVDGTVQPDDPEDSGRLWADERATG
ncbi:hypothetical protein MRQ36_05220 [Micromonospora sp. R77]|uniref:hypothetical protein n=1 Tax=Micromonospora sp. R77 TaxID=2925836 RepID=UPI001F60029E|nr:hypothetical protein [Micromonospora sp. R77]MCI4061997.1 hypothetical protein [Micromonospora sp. R77]